MATRRTVWSVQAVRDLGVTTDAVTAGEVLGFGRSTTYQLLTAGAFPIPVRKVGRRYLVAVAHLLQAVGVEP